MYLCVLVIYDVACTSTPSDVRKLYMGQRNVGHFLQAFTLKAFVV